MNELVSKLGAIYGIVNTMGKTVISLGYPSGMDKIDFTSLTMIRKKFGTKLKNVSYNQLAVLLEEKKKDAAYMSRVEKQAEAYLAQPHVTLKTGKEFIARNFLLKNIIVDMMEENNTYAFAIGQCMSGIAPIAETTACMSLGLLNDDDYVATCEGDFVVAPGQMMLNSICGKPTFLVDPTWANNGMVSLAHCAGTAKMDGKKFDKIDVMTHYESDYGAAQRCHLEVGRVVTVLIPDFNVEKYILFTGKVLETPKANMCRSHVDISINGDYKKLNKIMRGFHWLMCYDDCMDQMKYALEKVGIEVLTI
jgi:L-fucose isomerase-like protein